MRLSCIVARYSMRPMRKPQSLFTMAAKGTKSYHRNRSHQMFPLKGKVATECPTANRSSSWKQFVVSRGIAAIYTMYLLPLVELKFQDDLSDCHHFYDVCCSAECDPRCCDP